MKRASEPKLIKEENEKKNAVIQHRNRKEWRACIDASREYLLDFGAEESVCAALALALFQNGQYADALTEYEEMHKTSIGKVPFQIVRTCIGKLYKDKEYRTYAWRRFTAPEDVRFGRASELFAAGKILEARQAFSSAVDQGFSSEGLTAEHRSVIVECFDMLCSNERPECSKNDDSYGDPIKKVIVSGMGWSGSGAIYDYFREFHDVVAIKGEAPYIEGAVSLRTIRKHLDRDDRLRTEIINFFFKLIIGRGYWEDSGDFKLFNHARQRFRKFGPDDYLSRARSWCCLAASLWCAPKHERFDIFRRLADFTVDTFCIDQPIAPNEIALLDNVVHIQNVECIEFLTNTTIFCCFRDPRSNYVALLREASHYKSDVNSYIQNRSKSYARAEQAVNKAQKKCMDEPDKKVFRVQFEQFVVSQKLRSDYAREVGLSVGESNPYKYFKPWQSFRNVLLHHEHFPQAEIEAIQSGLGEYCYDLDVVPFGTGGAPATRSS